MVDRADVSVDELCAWFIDYVSVGSDVEDSAAVWGSVFG